MFESGHSNKDPRPRILPSEDPLTVSKDRLLTLTCRYAIQLFIFVCVCVSLLSLINVTSFKFENKMLSYISGAASHVSSHPKFNAQF